MGTNYYTRMNECTDCGRYDTIHLGKASAGWQFSFQYNGGKLYKNVEEMRAWLKGKKIRNEYGALVSHKRFWEMVNEHQKEKLNHAKYVKKDYGPERAAYEHVIDGYSFSDVEFS